MRSLGLPLYSLLIPCRGGQFQLAKHCLLPLNSSGAQLVLHSILIRVDMSIYQLAVIGPAVRADFRRLYPANAKTPTCCPSDDNRTKVTNSVMSARSLWWHVGPYFWPTDLTRTANPIGPGQLLCKASHCASACPVH